VKQFGVGLGSECGTVWSGFGGVSECGRVWSGFGE
jgi:hypothetical protein